ncbi:MAG: tetratricopeptide repeat protein, partial [Candidatus Heimdallarchaeota archaeon]|nr:tetratricopeptide repeat protein [Candidatus Heimdallarchaeota archaeon]MCK4611641.1 tetratricopeptide repeat protein [Candidatus Heimdallarchaeota archaeon]
MSFSFQEELEKIEKAIVKGEYHESLEKLDKLLQIKEITVKEHVKAKILQTRILFFLGIFEWRNSYFEQGLIIIKDAVEKSQSINNNLLLFDSLYWKIYCSARKSAEKLEILLRLESLVEDIRKDYPSEYKRKQAFFLGVKAYESNWKISIGEEVAKDHKEKSIKLFVQSYEIFKEIDDKEHMLILMSAIIYSYGLEAKYDLLLEYLKKALKTAEQIDNKYFIAFFTYTLSTEFYWPRGELELFLEFLNKARRIYEELDNRRAIAQSDNVLGIYYIEKGEMERAAEYYKKALKFFEESGEPDMISALLNNLGLIFSTKGDYAKALEYLSKAYEISMKEKNLPRAFSQQLNVARIHSLKGELDKALELQKECLEYYEKIGDLPRISFSLLSLGLTYQSKGMNEKAMECFKRNLHFNEKIGNKLTLARSLSQLIVLLIEIGNRNEALKYFKQLKTINSELINTAINQFYRFSDAVILKSNSDIRDRIKAETLLEQLLEEELVIGMDLTSVIIYLTEVLIEEFKRT